MSRGLWSIIEEHSERTMLTNLALDARSSPECDVSPQYILGINASRWGLDSQVRVHFKSKAQRPELEVLFRRLGALLKSPVTPLFVFDALDKPETELGKLLKVNLKTREGLRQLITACGYPCYDAPCLAEAELARLNVEKIVDAVVSEDGRAILFGARTVLYDRGQDIFGDSYGEEITVYRVPIYRVPALMDGSLSPPSRGSLLLHHLLAGLAQFPSQVSLALAGLTRSPPGVSVALASDSLGDNLLNAVTSLRGKALERRLRALVYDLCAAVVRFRTLVPAHHARRLVDDCVIPGAFPYSPRRADKPYEYVEDIGAFSGPLTSWSSGYKGGIPTRDAVALSTPDLALLTIRCRQLLGWDDEDTVCSNFRSWIWDGIFTREVQAYPRADHGAAIQNASDVALPIFRIAGKLGTTATWLLAHGAASDVSLPVVGIAIGKLGKTTTWFLARYDPSRYAAITRSALLSLSSVSPSSIVATASDKDEPSDANQKVTLGGVWVPAPVLKRACLVLVDQYEEV